jgi:hypothetical protein
VIEADVTGILHPVTVEMDLIPRAQYKNRLNDAGPEWVSLAV